MKAGDKESRPRSLPGDCSEEGLPRKAPCLEAKSAFASDKTCKHAVTLPLSIPRDRNLIRRLSQACPVHSIAHPPRCKSLDSRGGRPWQEEKVVGHVEVGARLSDTSHYHGTLDGHVYLNFTIPSLPRQTELSIQDLGNHVSAIQTSAYRVHPPRSWDRCALLSIAWLPSF